MLPQNVLSTLNEFLLGFAISNLKQDVMRMHTFRSRWLGYL